MQTTVAVQRSAGRRLLVLSAWVAILLISDFPDIIWNTIFGRVPSWSIWMKAAVPCLLWVGCLLWERLHPLRPFAAVMATFCLALAGSRLVADTQVWRSRFGGTEASFVIGFVGEYIRDSCVALAVLAALWVIKRRRAEFFLVKGDLAAPIAPVPWLGIRTGESWRTFGWIFTAVASLAVMVPTILALRPSSDLLLRALPLLPAVLLFSAVNAFNEEIYFRASLLSTLPAVVGRSQAIVLTVVLFGLAHWLYGSPAGLVGFLMTGFLAWLLAKGMIETRGIAWPWVMHFVPDVVVFASYAVLWVQR